MRPQDRDLYSTRLAINSVQKVCTWLTVPTVSPATTPCGKHHGHRESSLPRPPVIGFDLDLMLIDTREATAHALRTVNKELGERIDVDAFVSRLGPPIRGELRQWVPEARLDAAIAAFRATFTSRACATCGPAKEQRLSCVP